MTKINSFKNKLLIFLLIYLSAFMLISPHKSVDAVLYSVELCGRVIIPSLFPFIFCSNLFISLGAPSIVGRYLSKPTYKIFGISGRGAIAIILGVLCGYPIGAVCVSSLYQNGDLSKNEAEKLISYCNNASPMFVIVAVGVGYLSSYKTGVLLYAVHIISSFIYGFISKYFLKEKQTNALYSSRDENNINDCVLDIGNGITNAIDSILKICGFIIIFSVIIAAIPDFAHKPYISALLEISSGIKQITEANIGKYTLPIISAFLSFSGISVLAQVSAIATPVGLSVKSYAIGKSIQAGISFVITEILLKIFPNYIPTFLSYTNLAYYIPTERELIYTSLITLIFGVIVTIILMIIAFIADKFNL